MWRASLTLFILLGSVAHAHDPYWLKLLHYKQNPLIFRGDSYRSLVDDPAFFISPEGRSNPEAELAATFDALAKDSQTACRFPDRANYLKRAFPRQAAGWPKASCPEWDAWARSHQPQSVTLIFASHYLGSPGSAFGHTLLRLNKQGGGGDSTRLLDYGVNYAADPTTQNPIAYTFLGLTGGFKGTFSNAPYYLKLEEYSAIENRGLWEMDLDLSTEQSQRLLEHLWSLGHARPSYYYFDLNCSYWMLAALEVARPDWNLTSHFSLWVIPTETLKALPVNARKETRFRPSLRQQFQAAIDSFSDSERAAFRLAWKHARRGEDLAKWEPEALQSISEQTPASQIRVWDALLTGWRWKHAKTLATIPEALLERRSKLGAGEPARTIAQEPEQGPPLAAHGPWRMGVGAYASTREWGFEAKIRPALHDWNASSAGFPPQVQLQFLDTQIRFHPRDFVRFEKITVLEAAVINPVTSYEFPFSWWLGIEFRRPRDAALPTGMEGLIHLGIGAAAELFGHLQIYGIPGFELTTSPEMNPGYRFNLGGRAGVLLRFEPRFSAHLSARAGYGVWGLTGPTLEARLEGRFSPLSRLELRAHGASTLITQELGLQIGVYF